MAKAKVVKKIKGQGQAQAEASAPVASAEVPVVAPVVAPAPAPVPGKAEEKKGRKLRVNDTPDEAKARWARRLARWQGKAEKAGVDARALMTAALAG